MCSKNIAHNDNRKGKWCERLKSNVKTPKAEPNITTKATIF